VQRKNNLRRKKTHSQRSFSRPHRVMSSNGQHDYLRPIELTDQLHISKDRRISGMVEHGSVRKSQYISRRNAHIVSSLFILCR